MKRTLFWRPAQSCFTIMAAMIVGVITCNAASVLVGTAFNGIGESAVSNLGPLAQRFVLNEPAQVVEIDLHMSGFGTDAFSFWLTNSIGPSTTAANVLLATNLTFPNTGGGISGQTIAYQTNLSLGAGSYFLVLSSLQSSIFQGWIDGGTILQTAIGNVGSFFAASPNFPGGSIDVNFPPASTFTTLSLSNADFQIIGTVPENGPRVLVPLGLIIIFAIWKLAPILLLLRPAKCAANYAANSWPNRLISSRLR